MKRNITVLAMILILAMVFTACQSKGDDIAVEPETPEETEQTPESGGESSEGQEEKAPAPSYKDMMLPFNQLVGGDRIVILQNTLNYSREGFYTEDTKPATHEITYNGESVKAYPIRYTLDFLARGIDGTVSIINNDGSSQEVAGEEFLSLFVIVDFTSSDAPLLYNPESGLELKDMLYALTEQGEAIYSVTSGSTYNTADLVSSVGWDVSETTYRYMATDRFYIPVSPAENATGEIRGTLSGAVNGSFPELKIASGKINDVIYIEIPGEGGK